MFYLTHFYLRLYGVGQMVRDYEKERRNVMSPLPINSKGSFICTTYKTVHSTIVVIPVVEHCLEREIPQWVHQLAAISLIHERTL